ncbi:MAG: histidine--tRNA ligase [Filifactoraceae bacterium]
MKGVYDEQKHHIIINMKQSLKLSAKPAKGTFDVLPDDMELRNWVKDIITDAYTKRGYMQLETPCIENIENLTNSEAGENLRMIFKILKRGEKLQLESEIKEDELCDLGLRFDLTLPLSRYYANNNNELIKPFKAFQMGPVWRAERNQKGRYRQFVQCDIDTIGDNSIYAEIDLMLTVPMAIKNLGFTNTIIKINDRRILKQLIIDSGFEEKDFETVCIIADKKDKIGEDGVAKELFEKGYNQQQITKLSESLLSSLADIEGEAAADLRLLIDIVSRFYRIEFDPTLVRGMGYYTGPIFEIVSPDFNGSIAGGGRYDGLLSKFSKDHVPAVGFSIGFERIIGLLKDKNFKLPNRPLKYAVLFVDEEKYEEAVDKANYIIAKGSIASLYKIKKNKLGNMISNFKKNGYEIEIVE